MKYITHEKIRIHNYYDTLKGIFANVSKIFILLIISPILLISLFIDLFKKNEKIVAKNDWTIFYNTNNLLLERLFIDENELPDDLDYPEEPNDIYIFKLKSNPEIVALSNSYFDYQYCITDTGIFLLSFNKKGEGMSIWFIDNSDFKVELVKNIASSWWNMGLKNDKLILTTTHSKKDIQLEIEIKQHEIS